MRIIGSMIVHVEYLVNMNRYEPLIGHHVYYDTIINYYSLIPSIFFSCPSPSSKISSCYCLSASLLPAISKYRTPSRGQRVISRSAARNTIIVPSFTAWTATSKDSNYHVHPYELIPLGLLKHTLRTFSIRNPAFNFGRKVWMKCTRLQGLRYI